MTNRVTPDGIRAAGALLAPKDPEHGMALMRTVMQVESAGSGFDRKGRTLILYEPHIAYREAQKIAPDKLGEMKSIGVAYEKWGSRPYPKDSYPAFMRAAQVHPEVAHRACSWGLPQILGSNFSVCGYKSAIAMAADFATGEDAQLAAMARFIIANPAMRRALLALDWAEFARRYNGPGYAKNAYDKKLAAAYAKFKTAPAAGLNKIGAGQTAQGRAEKAKAQAAVIGAGGAATGGVTTSIEVPAPVAPEAPGGFPWGVVLGGVILAAAIGISIRLILRNRPSERAPEIEIIIPEPSR